MSKITRRRFFEESMIATAVAATAAASARAVPEADEPKNATANNVIRHAVIGCRTRGKVHVAEFTRMPGVEVAYVCDPDSQLAAELAAVVEKQTGKRPKAVPDLRTIIDDKSIDTISIAAPNHWHALAAIWGMQSGKHVYCEKPLCHTVVEGRRMIEVANATGKLCQTGTQRRSDTSLQAAAQYIQSGKLGKVTFARSIIYGKRGSIGPKGNYEIPKHVDYNLFMGPAPLTPLTRKNLHYDWHWEWDTGNGELGNNNIHMIDVCRMLMGIKGLGDSVLSLGGRLGYEDAGETPNTQIVVHTFGDATIVQEVRGLKSDPFSKIFTNGWVVHGTEGFVADSSVFDKDGKLIRKFDGKAENHFVNFMKAVRSGKRSELRADVVEGHQSTALCHVGNIAYRLGKTESTEGIAKYLQSLKMHEEVARTFQRMTDHLKDNGVDLDKTKLRFGPLLKLAADKEAFADSREANLLLDKEYRKPFELPRA